MAGKKKIKEALTHIVFVLDKSGSMDSCSAATISGFNEYKNDQARQPGKASFTLALFDTTYTIRHKAVPIDTVPDLTAKTYVPGGGTALYDAVGRTITSVDQSIVDGEAVIFVIMTDGEENSSNEFTHNQIFAMIDERKAKGWSFVFLGANQDAYAVGATFGLAHGNTLNYAGTSASVSSTMGTLSGATTRMRGNVADHGVVAASAMNYFTPDEQAEADVLAGKKPVKKAPRKAPAIK